MSRDSSKPKFKFDVEPYHGSVDALNKVEERAGTSAYRDAEHDIRRAGKQKTLSLSRARAWADHPDVRVLISLLENPNKPWDNKKLRWYVLTAAYRRGVLMNKEHGVDWNPLLDALDAAGAWGSSSYGRKYADFMKNQKEVPLWRKREMESEDNKSHVIDYMGSQLFLRGKDRPIGDWLVSDERKPEEILDLLENYRAKTIRNTIADAGILQGGVLRVLLEDVEMSARVSKNPNFRAEEWIILQQWVVNHLETDAGETVHTIKRRGARTKHRTVANYMVDALHYAANRSFVPNRDTIEKLVGMVKNGGYRTFYDEKPWGAFFGLLSSKGLNHDDLMVLLEPATKWKYALRRVGTYEDAPVSFARELVKLESVRRNKRIMTSLARRESVARDPVVSKVLARSVRNEVEAGMISNARGESFRKVFVRKANEAKDKGEKHTIQRIVRAIEERDEEVLSDLKSSDLVPLLQHPEREIRIFATQALREAGKNVEKTKNSTSRGGR